MLGPRRRVRGTPVLIVSQEQITALSILGEPQGNAAVVHQRWQVLPRPDNVRSGVLLCFEEVRSHGNIGTIIRSAQASGAQGFCFIGDAVNPFNPRAIRPTMGAISHQELIRTSTEMFLRWGRNVRCSVVGTSAEARQDFYAIRYAGPTVIMLGNERKGLSGTQRDLCDTLNPSRCAVVPTR